MKSIDRRFDVIVIGSGAGGSIAVKELTERGLDVLLLEAGRDLTEADFAPPPPKVPRPLGMDLDLRAKAMLAGQHRQSRRSFFSETSNRFLVSDRENPYSTPRDAPYLWVRGRILGGRLNVYGRVLQRMSDVDFKAASRDGYGADWPFSYADLERWYDHVEDIMGVYGNKDGLSHPRTASTSARRCSPPSKRSSGTRSRSAGPSGRSSPGATRRPISIACRSASRPHGSPAG